jgi:hypothetical protein
MIVVVIVVVVVMMVVMVVSWLSQPNPDFPARISG